MLARCVHLPQGLAGFRPRGGGAGRLDPFEVGRIVAAGGKGDHILAGIGQHMEFMRGIAADIAGIGQHGAVFEAEPREYPAIGLIHLFIGLGQRGLVQMKRIGVFHEEFARAHDAEARSYLVAELGLDLIKVHGQLFVAADLAPREVGDDLFMGRAEAEFALMPVIEAQ